MSLGIFLMLATLITISVARSLGASTTARVERAGEAAMSNQLTKLASLPYEQLVRADFTVPDPCPDTPAGIAGQSCVTSGAAQIRVAYQFQDLSPAAGADVVGCADAVTPRGTSDAFGYVGLCARVVSVSGSTLSADDLALETSTRVTAPSPQYRPGAGVIRVKLTGQWRDLLGSSVFLLKTASPATQVTSAQVQSDTVFLSVPVGDDVGDGDTCSAISPCMLGLNPGTRPTISNGVALFGSTAAGPSARVVAGAGSITETTVEVLKVGTARLDLVATNGTLTGTNPIPGSVCLWASFVDADVRREVPVCNTGSEPGRIILDTYDPSWQSPTTAGYRYPFPPATPIQVRVDHSDGVCYRAPDMYGSVPGANEPGTEPGWGTRAVCTSHTWGVPDGLDVPVELATNASQVRRTVTWDAGNVAAVPAAGYPGAGEVWTKPRQAAACATDATCRTVTDVALEPLECPGAHCFSGTNREPVVADPGTRLVRNDVAGTSAPFKVVLDDPEGDPITVTTGGRNLGTGTLRWATTENGTYSTLPAAGATLPGTGTGTRTLWFTYTRAAGDTALRTFDLVLSDGVGTGARTETVGLYFADAPWTLTAGDVDAAQGGTGTAAVTVTNTSGTPASGQDVTFSSATPGVTFAPGPVATTGPDGTANVRVSVGAVPAGRHPVTATTASGRAVTFDLVVTPSAGTLTVAATGGPQASTGSVTVTARDKAGTPLRGVAVTVAALRDGQSTDVVYPKFTGCSTDDAGRCTVPLVIEAGAAAGQYHVRASSGGHTTPDATITVTQAPGALRTDPAGGAVAAQGDDRVPARLVLVDRAGTPIRGATLNLTGHPGIQVSPASAVTGTDGSVTATVAVAPTTTAGTYELTGTVGGLDLRWHVRVKVATKTLEYVPVTVAQDSSTVVDVTVRDTAGHPVPGALIRFAAAAHGLTLDSRATSGPDGVAHATLSAAAVPAGQYVVTATVDDVPHDLAVTVVPTAKTVSLSGAVGQGETGQPFIATVRDAAGDPVPDVPVTVAWNAATLVTAPHSGRTDASGRFAFLTDDTGPTPAGTYLLNVTTPTLQVHVPVPVTALPGSVTVTPGTVQLGSNSTRTVTVTVTDRAGAPLPGQQIRTNALDGAVSATNGGPTGKDGRTTLTFATGPVVTGRQQLLDVTTSDGGATTSLPFVLLAPATAAHASLDPVALWPLDSDDEPTGPGTTLPVHDVTFNRVGTLHNPQSGAADGYSPGSRYTRFGPGTYATVPDPDADLIPAQDAFTVTGWVRPQDLTYPRTGIAISKGQLSSSSPGPGFAIGEASAASTLQVELADGTRHATGLVNLPAGTQVSDWVGQWTQVTAVFDRPAGTAWVYVNGEQVGSVPITAVTGSVATPSPLLINDNAGWSVDGGIDDVAVYAKALTPGQVRALYNTRIDAATANVLATGPVSYYKLGQTSGDFTDHGPLGHDAAPRGEMTRGVPGLAARTDEAVQLTGGFAVATRSDRYQAAELTVTGWVRVDGGQGTWRGMVGSRGAATNPTEPGGVGGWNIYAGQDNTWQFWTGTGTPSWNALRTGVPVTIGQTVHVAVTHADGTGRFYLNGKLVAKMPMDRVAAGTALFVGSLDATKYPLPGVLDEVTVHDRALSDTEIGKVYADGRR